MIPSLCKERFIVVLAMIVIGWQASVRADEPPRVANAAERNDTATVKELVEAGGDLDAPQADGMTALHWAAYHDNAEMLEWLLVRHANAQVANRYHRQPLHLACTNGSTPCVAQLLAAGADSNAVLPGGETPLHLAARTGRLDPVRRLLAHGAQVNAVERRGQTALMWATAEGHADVVQELITAGGDVKARLPSGFSPLLFAVREGHQMVVERLIAAGVDVNEAAAVNRRVPGGLKDQLSALHLAIENGHFELASLLLKAGAEPNDQRVGYAPLHALSWVRKPIRGDGDPPPIGSGRVTSLEFARNLITHGADVNIRLAKGESGRGRFTTTGSTPFLLAARTSDLPYLRLLNELGADTTLTNVDGTTPILAAAGVGALGDGDDTAGTEAEAIETVRYLLTIGAKMNDVDVHGETVMHGAAYQSRAQLVDLLIEQGADLKLANRRNEWGWTALMIAEGHRPGNFRPAPETVAAISRGLRLQGLEPISPAIDPEKR